MGGVVVAPQPVAAEAGAEILKAGGNAFDAGVAAAFFQAAADPFMCGIGGFGVAGVFAAETGESLCVEFYARAGAAARAEMWGDRVRQAGNDKTYVEGYPNEIGYQSIGVPGTVAGLAEIHRRWGTLPWAELVRPAAAFLRDGFPLYQYIADYFTYPAGPPAKPSQQQRLGASPEMARIWLSQAGGFRQAGERVHLTDYADTLDRLAAAGGDDFYRGDLAAAITADLAANGSMLTARDLADYRARVVRPLATSYRGLTVTAPPPPGGGATLLQMFNILAHFDPAAIGHNSPAYLDVLARTMQLAASERRAKLGDPAFVDVPLDQMLDADWAAAAAADIRAGNSPAPAGPPADPGTTHLTVVDDAGNALALTHTLGMGSGVITPGLGFQYNNAVGGFDPEPDRPNSLAAGKSRISAMSPTLVMRDGRPYLVLGSPGSNAIVNAIVQTVVNAVDLGLPPLAAVSAPRIHAEGGPVSLETRFLRSTAAALAAAGHDVVHGAVGYDTLQGRVQLAVAGADGWRGASDPRRDGGIAARA